MSRVAIGVISWNTRDLTRQCLESVRADRPEEVVVVDNGSADGSPEMVRQEFPEARVIVNPHNPGFGAAGNQIFALTGAPYVLLLLTFAYVQRRLRAEPELIPVAINVD